MGKTVSIIRPRAITQADISDLLGTDPRRGEGSLVAHVQNMLEYWERSESEAECARRTR